MSTNRDLRLIVKCAKMYYEENIKQLEIGKQLGISKATVSRILNEAKKLGIVKISVENPYSEEFIGLEKDLETKYKLNEVIITDTNSDDPKEVNKAIARDAAKYLQRVLAQDSLIGVSSGTTLCEIAKYVDNNRSNDFTFIPMIGGNGQTKAEIQSNNIVVNLARVFKADYRILNAPAMVEDIESKDVFLRNPSISSVLSMFKELDAALVGIGSSTSSSTVTMVAEYITEEELDVMRENGAVADICNYFIDETGDDSKYETNQRIIGIDLNDLRSVPLIIGVAGGEDKLNAIKAVLNTEILNVLITDITTARLIYD